MNEAFVYCWTDKLTNKLYLGSHKGTKDDGYICSSKLMLEQYNKRPHDFIRQIVAEGNYEDIRELEIKLLKTLDASRNPDFYNMHNGNGKRGYLKGHTEETKRKIGAKNKMNMLGKKFSKNTKNLLSELLVERWKRPGFKELVIPKLKGKRGPQKNLSPNRFYKRKPVSQETKQKLRIAAFKQWERQHEKAY